MKAGLGWRQELGAGILANLDRIGVIEVMAEDFFDAPARARRALQFLASQVPVVVHATSLGLAGTEPVDRRALDRVARVLEWLKPRSWSEHLAFVRASGVEVGHLAAPPRNDTTLDALAANVATARRITGMAPLLENVATLIEPPLSTYGEDEWLNAVASRCGTALLLDLHNLYANATNFGFNPVAVLERIPESLIGIVHIAGGRRIEGARILDDHLHAVPDPVFDLLEHVRLPDGFLILERDGRFPPVEKLLEDLDRARSVIGRKPHLTIAESSRRSNVPAASPGPSIDAFLARLYTDATLLGRFTDDPGRTAAEYGFPETTIAALLAVDSDDLQVAAQGFARKRSRKALTGRPSHSEILRRLRGSGQ